MIAKLPKSAPSQPVLRASGAQERAIESASSLLDEVLLEELIVGMTAIPSPTGEEGALAQWLAARLEHLELDGRYQPIDDQQGNAIGRLRGDGRGDELLLYAPIDTFTTGNADEDLPWVGGDRLRGDLVPAAHSADGFVSGLGASNPKAHGAAIIAAVDAVRRAGVPLDGDVVIALCAGGMPTNKRPIERARRFNAGQGTGCAFFLEQGGQADHAIICKPGWAVHWEEVGLCWFEVRVLGRYGYVGSRHRVPYLNPIVAAAPLITELDSWFVDYAERWTDGLVAPQGNIGSIEAGFPHLLSISSAVCRIRFDLRISPRATPTVVKREVDAALSVIAERHGLELDWDMVLSIPGTVTDPDARVVRAAIGSWEYIEGRAHEPILANSGATDANILRQHGIPTARIGMQRVGDGAPYPPDFARGMNVVEIREAARLARALIHSVVVMCGSSILDD